MLRRSSRLRARRSPPPGHDPSKERLSSRFRRNRELLARESIALGLWLTLGAMLLFLARSMVPFAQKQMADQRVGLRIAVLLVPVLGALGSLWRSWSCLRNWRQLQLQQREVLKQLREAANR